MKTDCRVAGKTPVNAHGESRPVTSPEERENIMKNLIKNIIFYKENVVAIAEILEKNMV